MSAQNENWFDDDLADDFWLGSQQEGNKEESSVGEKSKVPGAGVSPALAQPDPPPSPSVMEESNRDDWFSDNDDDDDYDHYYNNDNDVDDPDSCSLPAGQGMNFSNVSLSPVPLTLVPSQLQDFSPPDAFASLFKKPLSAASVAAAAPPSLSSSK